MAEPTRLFIAVWPPAHVVDRLASLPRPDEPGVRWVPSTNWHVTVRFVGTADADALAARLDGVDLPAATAEMGPAARPLGSHGLVIPVSGVDELARTVLDATRDIGQLDADRRFRGHLTLARLRRGAQSTVADTPFDARFMVEQIALVRSDLEPNGARYSTIGTWPVG